MNDNKNKIALVTGAARGIGRGISMELAKAGFTVAAVGTKPEEAVEEYLAELRAISPDSSYIQGNIAVEADRKNIIDTAYSRYSTIDVLVNNAGVAPKVRADLLEMSEESFDFVTGVNLKGVFFLTQYAANRMIAEKRSGFRCIIFVTSISTEVSSINRGEYCMSKAGLGMAVKLYADRLASEGINVYELRPGIIATDMTAGVRGKYDALIEGGILPIKRIGEPSDIGKAAAALADGALAYSTGETINIDGGFMLRRL